MKASQIWNFNTRTKHKYLKATFNFNEAVQRQQLPSLIEKVILHVKANQVSNTKHNTHWQLGKYRNNVSTGMMSSRAMRKWEGEGRQTATVVGNNITLAA